MKKRGISLIVLVITIIVIIILAGTVMISLASNNPIAQAEEAKFKSDVNTYDSQLSLALANEYVNDYTFNPSSINKDSSNIQEYITSMTDEDAVVFEIKSGKLIYTGEDLRKQIWSEEILSQAELGANIIATENTTVNGAIVAYNNPIIPKGFKAINTDDANWLSEGSIVTDWNNGLVIEDENGNQFVWVPVKDGIGIDGTYVEGEVQYEKWCTRGIDYNEVGISDDTFPLGVDNETDQISTYGGFYIGRYEAGNDNGIICKENKDVWTDITYMNSKIAAEGMYTTAEVKSGLLTGSQWDTVMKWISNLSGDEVKDVTASKEWGNYDNSPVDEHGVIHKTGYSDIWKAKNIYDLAGNTWEWTNEKFDDTHSIVRGGAYHDDGDNYAASYRDKYDIYTFYLSFRVVLYIL